MKLQNRIVNAKLQIFCVYFCQNFLCTTLYALCFLPGQPAACRWRILRGVALSFIYTYKYCLYCVRRFYNTIVYYLIAAIRECCSRYEHISNSSSNTGSLNMKPINSIKCNIICELIPPSQHWPHLYCVYRCPVSQISTRRLQVTQSLLRYKCEPQTEGIEPASLLTIFYLK